MHQTYKHIYAQPTTVAKVWNSLKNKTFQKDTPQDLHPFVWLTRQLSLNPLVMLNKDENGKIGKEVRTCHGGQSFGGNLMIIFLLALKKWKKKKFRLLTKYDTNTIIQIKHICLDEYRDICKIFTPKKKKKSCYFTLSFMRVDLMQRESL